MILCNGEAIVDMVPRQSPEGEACFAPFAGGAIFNTAIALGRLGSETAYFGGISNDFFGEILIDGLQQSHVDTTYTVRSDRPSTLAFVQLENGHAKYTFNDENTAGRMLATEDIPIFESDITTLFFGGISLVVEPCAQVFEALLQREHLSKVVMLDPNIRPSFIRDEDGYRDRIERLISMCDIVKLSDEDLTWLVGEGDFTTAANKLLSKGPKLVFVTEGATGAHGFTRNSAAFVPSKKVTVVDTIGAGDTFNAGILNALDKNDLLSKKALLKISEGDIIDALENGAAAASITVSRAGANPPWAEEVKR